MDYNERSIVAGLPHRQALLAGASTLLVAYTNNSLVGEQWNADVSGFWPDNVYAAVDLSCQSPSYASRDTSLHGIFVETAVTMQVWHFWACSSVGACYTSEVTPGQQQAKWASQSGALWLLVQQLY